jgi:hypothetical protein
MTCYMHSFLLCEYRQNATIISIERFLQFDIRVHVLLDVLGKNVGCIRFFWWDRNMIFRFCSKQMEIPYKQYIFLLHGMLLFSFLTRCKYLQIFRKILQNDVAFLKMFHTHKKLLILEFLQQCPKGPLCMWKWHLLKCWIFSYKFEILMENIAKISCRKLSQ